MLHEKRGLTKQCVGVQLFVDLTQIGKAKKKIIIRSDNFDKYLRTSLTMDPITIKLKQ